MTVSEALRKLIEEITPALPGPDGYEPGKVNVPTAEKIRSAIQSAEAALAAQSERARKSGESAKGAEGAGRPGIPEDKRQRILAARGERAIVVAEREGVSDATVRRIWNSADVGSK